LFVIIYLTAFRYDIILSLINKFNFFGKKYLPGIPEYYHISSSVAQKNILYEYNNGSELHSDFQLIPQLLQNNKINKARYLLNKIIYSNADFKIRERAHLFIKFIPKLDANELNDFIGPQDIRENPILFSGATIRWGGFLEKKISSYSYILRINKKILAECYLTEKLDMPQIGSKLIIFGEYQHTGADNYFKINVRSQSFQK
jgi:hypothetical protein